jgi:hypothetical protein
MGSSLCSPRVKEGKNPEHLVSFRKMFLVPSHTLWGVQWGVEVKPRTEIDSSARRVP